MEHDWEDVPLRQEDSLAFRAFRPDGSEVEVEVGLDVIVDVKSLRRCRRCGQVSVDGADPEDACDEALARQVMES